MLDIATLLSIDKVMLPETSKIICEDDLNQLIGWLSEKDDKIRYQAFQLLQYRAASFEDVYPYWNTFCEKLKSDNSYQRSIGLMLIAENAKWDKENRINGIIDEYLNVLNDEKPITVRQCVQSLSKIVPCKMDLHQKIANRLMSLNLADIRDTMRKSVLIDILGILAMIRKNQTNNEIECYIFNALSGGLLDKKAVKQIETLL